MKFFTSLCFIAFLIGFTNCSAQILIQDTTSGKTKEIQFGSKIYYTLKSDSVLGVELTPDYRILTTSADSMLIFADGTEISAFGINYLEIENKRAKKWQGRMSPFLIGGLAFLSKGITMLVAEGTESKNEELVPFYMGIGGGVTILSGIPFYIKNKSYDLSKGKYTIITP